VYTFPLSQGREAVKVLVECCAREATYNPFYGALAARLCFDPLDGGQHKFTLQLCFWDA